MGYRLRSLIKNQTKAGQPSTKTNLPDTEYYTTVEKISELDYKSSMCLRVSWMENAKNDPIQSNNLCQL